MAPSSITVINSPQNQHGRMTEKSSLLLLSYDYLTLDTTQTATKLPITTTDPTKELKMKGRRTEQIGRTTVAVLYRLLISFPAVLPNLPCGTSKR